MSQALFRRQFMVLPNGLEPEECTLDICPLEYSSYWTYLPSLAANGLFIGLFSISLILYLLGIFWSKRFLAFSIAMILGNLTEIIGYAGRIMSHSDPFTETGFLINIVCLSIGPAFFAAGIYFCISRIVITYGVQHSRISPRAYPRIFIPCDIISLTLQGAGGGMSASAEDQDLLDTGTNIMIAGLAFQVAVMFVFMAIAGDFALRTYRAVKRDGRANTLDPKHAELRQSFMFKGFLVALALATILIFTRCVFRVAELSEGFDGDLANDEPLFIALESVPVVLAVLLLNVFNPNFSYKYERSDEGADADADADAVESKGKEVDGSSA